MIIPNFCHNILLVSGELDKLNELKQKAEGVDYWRVNNYNEFNLNNFIPAPNTIKTEKELRNWQIVNWGCREGVIRASVTPRYEMNSLDYAIITAQNPPVKALEKISKMFPELEFELIFKIPSQVSDGTLRFIGGSKV